MSDGTALDPEGPAETEEQAEVDDLERMLGAGSMIGRAVELLMARDGIDEEAAFNRLVHLAEGCQIRLRDAAVLVVGGGEASAAIQGQG